MHLRKQTGKPSSSVRRQSTYPLLTFYDRDLLADLGRYAWESLKLFLQEAVPEKNPIPGVVLTDAYGINNSGAIVGDYYGASPVPPAVPEPSTMLLLGSGLLGLAGYARKKFKK